MEIDQLKDIKSKLMGQLDHLQGKKILIVGDVGIDEYIWGDVKRISPEAPVPVVDVVQEDSRLGLSCNVAANVASLGGEPWLVSVVGEDQGRANLAQLMEKRGISSDHLIVDSSRPTTRKVRILAEQQQVVRVDFEKKQFIEKKIADQLFAKAKSLISKADVVVLQDYAKGTLTEDLCQKIISEAHVCNKVILVDPHRSTPVNYYKNADIFKPNKDEAMILSKLNYEALHLPNDLFEKAAESLKSTLNAKSVVLTMGKDGMLIYEDGQVQKIPTYAKQVFDVTGAGDTVIASMALGQAAGFTLEESCVMANLAAGIVVAQVGCVSCTDKELRSELESED